MDGLIPWYVSYWCGGYSCIEEILFFIARENIRRNGMRPHINGMLRDYRRTFYYYLRTAALKQKDKVDFEFLVEGEKVDFGRDWVSSEYMTYKVELFKDGNGKPRFPKIVSAR